METFSSSGGLLLWTGQASFLGDLHKLCLMLQHIFLLLVMGGFVLKKKKKVVRASDRILAVGFVNKLRRAWWWNLMEERDSGYLFQGGWFEWPGSELGCGDCPLGLFCGSRDHRGRLAVLAT